MLKKSKGDNGAFFLGLLFEFYQRSAITAPLIFGIAVDYKHLLLKDPSLEVAKFENMTPLLQGLVYGPAFVMVSAVFRRLYERQVLRREMQGVAEIIRNNVTNVDGFNDALKGLLSSYPNYQPGLLKKVASSDQNDFNDAALLTRFFLCVDMAARILVGPVRVFIPYLAVHFFIRSLDTFPKPLDLILKAILPVAAYLMVAFSVAYHDLVEAPRAQSARQNRLKGLMQEPESQPQEVLSSKNILATVAHCGKLVDWSHNVSVDFTLFAFAQLLTPLSKVNGLRDEQGLTKLGYGYIGLSLAWFALNGVLLVAKVDERIRAQLREKHNAADLSNSTGHLGRAELMLQNACSNAMHQGHKDNPVSAPVAVLATFLKYSRKVLDGSHGFATPLAIDFFVKHISNPAVWAVGLSAMALKASEVLALCKTTLEQSGKVKAFRSAFFESARSDSEEDKRRPLLGFD